MQFSIAMTSVNFLDLPPLLGASGTITLPGSKSISNRVLLLAALSDGMTEVRDLLHSDDTGRMLDGLRALDVKVEAMGGNALRQSSGPTYCVTGLRSPSRLPYSRVTGRKLRHSCRQVLNLRRKRQVLRQPGCVANLS